MHFPAADSKEAKNTREPRSLLLYERTNFLRALCSPTCCSAVKQAALLSLLCKLAELEPAGPSPAAPLALPRRPRQQDVRWCQVTSRLSAAGSPQPQRLGKGSPLPARLCGSLPSSYEMLRDPTFLCVSHAALLSFHSS